MRGDEQARAGRNWAALIEALGVFVLIMLYIWKLRIFHPSLWIVILGFVAGSHFPHREGMRKLGFGWRELRRGSRAVLPWVAGLALILAGAGALLGTAEFSSPLEALGSLVVYVLWGLFQQYLLNGYFVNRLVEFAGPGRTRAVPLAAALLFSAAHLPNWFLMSVTLIGGYACAAVYLRCRSLYVLGLAHGVIGFLINLVVPESVSGGFLIGPRYILQQFGIYPEQLL